MEQQYIRHRESELREYFLNDTVEWTPSEYECTSTHNKSKDLGVPKQKAKALPPI